MTYALKFPSKTIKIAGYDFALTVWKHHEAQAAHRFGEFSSVEQCIRDNPWLATWINETLS